MNVTTNMPHVSIAGTDVEKIEYQGQPVVTFAMIDKVHARVDGTARRAFNENRERFTGGDDFVTLNQPDEIRSLGFTRPQGGTPAAVVLITRRGYLKITKSLNDDRAWEVFDEMVERYFAVEAAPQQIAVPTTAEAFANAFQMIANTEKRQAQQEEKIAAISENVDRIAQSLMIHDRIPPNGELVTHLRKRVSKSFGLSFEVINRVLDTASVHPKFAVRNHHENAEGSVNYGYWQRDINLVFRKFVEECKQVTPTMCEHPYIDGRFRLIKKEIAPRSKNAVTLNGLGAF